MSSRATREEGAPPGGAGGGARRFPTTRWTLVQAAQASPEARRAALEELLAAYWGPLHGFMRRQGLAPDAAEDAVQGLVERLLALDFLSRVDPRKGRLRSYLLVAARHHLAHLHEAAHAARRGGGAPEVPLTGEEAAGVADAGAPSPDAAFDRAWAVAVMERALARLEREYGEGGRAGPFALVLAFFRPGAEPPGYREAAAAHGMSVPQLKSFLHRARAAYGAHVRAEVAETLAPGEDVEAELAALLRALGT
jgi:RNA polymerase sigma-70 factor (ECF subfamily)